MAADGVRAEALSNVDAAWLRMEHPTNLMMVSGVLLFDEPIEFARLRALLEQRLLRFERFRQRVVDSKLPWSRPHWETDPSFDVSAHVHRIALPAPGDQATLEALVSDFMSMPLDFSKPLWQFHLIENYGSGCVVLGRLHHSIADGIAMVRVLLSLTDDAPDTAWVEPGNRPRDRRAATILDQAAAALGQTARTVSSLVTEGVETLRHPERALDLAKLGVSGTAALSKLLLMAPDPQTVFKGKLGVAKRAAWSTPLPLGDVKAIGRAVGGTVNDVLLTAVTGALRRYLLGRGEPVAGVEFRAVVPVNLRSLEGPIELGNRFGLVFLALPVGHDDPIDRLCALKERMEEIKGSPEAMVAFGILNVIGAVPTEIEEQIVKMFGGKATAVMTNVPGPRQPIYLAGKPIRGLMFWVPQSGRLGLGVSIMSYAGAVTLGIATDAALVPDPETIIAGFHAEFEQLMGWVRQAPADEREQERGR
jgi:diacylglycerol O-acyltransferase / wax synthase